MNSICLRGLPLNLWSQQCFGKVVATLGTLITVDEKTISWECLEYARLLVKVSIGCNVWAEKRMKINGKVYNLALEVESTVESRPSCCCVNECNSSSESNSLCEGMNISSSVSEWSENEILLRNGNELENEERTVQTPVVYGDRKIHESSEKLDGDGNDSFFDRWGLQTINAVPESNLVGAQSVTGVECQNSAKNGKSETTHDDSNTKDSPLCKQLMNDECSLKGHAHHNGSKVAKGLKTT
ncbi:hypothetical protein DEO72_LG10g778 [Vigna unguiculata]|uniref:Uncharacterized protein n=1 Tax=Vigna unguiculata TaxID=3917 RepID=A0A4D6NCC0_VIGUN|nr:hypothetical protein DEO72_LG10g778 [Vigna unguiculata]